MNGFRAFALVFPLFVFTARAATSPLSYNRDIRPILSDNCFACHGPDQNKRKAHLRLDVREEAVAKKAIVPGKTEESELVHRIFSTDPEEVMPPAKSQKKLSPAQRELLRQWIAEGAGYQRHWAYIPPIKPVTAEGSAGIDSLIQKGLKEAGLQPSPQADRRTLIRRLCFDLTGLPPRPEEVEAFERDQSPAAYENLVERLLASPEYGERMAIGWLDVVRFADTIGYHSDNPRNVWPYRDYVIRAFNLNKPFDRFTREQLAGDLLPEPAPEQKVASAFNRLLLTTEEGGAQPKDYEARMLTDRVRAVSTVWMAQTFGCAQCHDHKFDPITSKDFYSLGAFFADLKEPIIGRREDGMLVPTPDQSRELDRLDSALGRVRRSFEAPRPELEARWERAAVQAVLMETNWIGVSPSLATSQDGKLQVDLDGAIHAGKDPVHGVDRYRITFRPGNAAITGLRLRLLPSDKLPLQGPGRAKDGGFSITEIQLEDDQGQPVELSSATATFETASSPAIAVIDGEDAPSSGWRLGGLHGISQAIYIALPQDKPLDPEAELTLVISQSAGENQVIGRFRLDFTENPGATAAPKALVPPPDIVEILKVAAPFRSPEQAAKLASYHRSIAPELGQERDAVAVAQKARDSYEASIPRCLISDALEKPRVVRILPRGNWMIETGEAVEPALPSYLAGADAGVKRRLNRLDLANWLVAPENPLTARVFVNRLWKQFFGTGISKSLEDFGSQGEAPVNAELLDWLACEFVASGWDVKHLVRTIVESQTYQQVSLASDVLQSKDPYNRILARQSRWRLEAELVRDNALRIAGLLNLKIGGPSAKPYQPDGYWENLNFPVRTYDASRGEDQYRRGLYCWWQRSYVHPSMLAFDAPTREECAAERTRSNIPQQALVLLNDPTYVEAARAFAGRILTEGGTDTTARINWAWRQALNRLPRPDELRTMETLVYKQLAEYQNNSKDAEALLKVGQLAPSSLDPIQLAAWTNAARVILNLHETITRS